MCEDLRLPDGTWCQTVGELRKAIYPRKLVADLPLYDRECLCAVNFGALAAREGWVLDRTEVPGTVVARVAP